jgi:hypothetical protein
MEAGEGTGRAQGEGARAQRAGSGEGQNPKAIPEAPRLSRGEVAPEVRCS